MKISNPPRHLGQSISLGIMLIGMSLGIIGLIALQSGGFK